jgi:hypothetical protein
LSCVCVCVCVVQTNPRHPPKRRKNPSTTLQPHKQPRNPTQTSTLPTYLVPPLLLLPLLLLPPPLVGAPPCCCTRAKASGFAPYGSAPLGPPAPPPPFYACSGGGGRGPYGRAAWRWRACGGGAVAGSRWGRKAGWSRRCWKPRRDWDRGRCCYCCGWCWWCWCWARSPRAQPTRRGRFLGRRSPPLSRAAPAPWAVWRAAAAAAAARCCCFRCVYMTIRRRMKMVMMTMRPLRVHPCTHIMHCCSPASRRLLRLFHLVSPTSVLLLPAAAGAAAAIVDQAQQRHPAAVAVVAILSLCVLCARACLLCAFVYTWCGDVGTLSSNPGKRRGGGGLLPARSIESIGRSSLQNAGLAPMAIARLRMSSAPRGWAHMKRPNGGEIKTLARRSVCSERERV